MKLKPFKLIPALIALTVIGAVCVLRLLNVDGFERLELMSYDMRARAALHFSPTIATNLGFVFIDEDSLRKVLDGSFGYRYGLLWPRLVYGKFLRELAEQAPKAVAFDVILAETRPDHPSVLLSTNLFDRKESDDWLGLQIRQASNVVVAVTKQVIPPPVFLTNAFAAGDITTDKDRDGILRRVQVFRYHTNWHAAFRQVQQELGFDLEKAKVEPRSITLSRGTAEDLESKSVPLDEHGNFDLADFGGSKLPAGVARKNKPYSLEPVWHMGVLLGAIELGCDLSKAEVDLAKGRIRLHGRGGLERIIPVDHDGYAFVDWCLRPEDPRLTKEAIYSFLERDYQRTLGQTTNFANRWRAKLAVVGSSSLVGNNLTDRGATPIDKDTLLVSKHWNVANSIITGRFIRRSPVWLDLLLIVVMGVFAAVLTWELRVLVAPAAMVLVLCSYLSIAFAIYIQSRYWLPIVLPAFCGALMTHVSLVTWRVVFEQAERRRVKGLFSTMVSPKVVNELLKSEKLSLGGARREITVLFADVRGFTQFTDDSQEQVLQFVEKNQLTGPAAEACFDKQARETLDTINLYLGLIADTITKHDGALDKFIGDCVMAFWGAPDLNPRHAVACVRAAIEAQRAVAELNEQRSKENEERQRQNAGRMASGLQPLPLLPVLQLGTGINTGMTTAGVMGSELKGVVRQGNYTVFGREVNLASRLEGLSGRGRIFIGEATYKHLLRDDPELAAKCRSMEPVKVKGISSAVNVYEVPWRRVAEEKRPEATPLSGRSVSEAVQAVPK